MSVSRLYLRDTLRLAGPVAIARLGIIGMALADVIVVGQLAPQELPHQALALAPVGVFLVAAIGLLQGVQVLAARAVGEGNPAGAGVAFKRGVALALAAGVAAMGGLWLGGERLFTVFGIDAALARPSALVMNVLALSIPLHLVYVAGTFFLEAIKKPGISMAVMWAANAVNLVLNLLWVPEHGAIGSAWATVGARVFLAAVLLGIIFSLKGRAHFGVVGADAKGPSFGALLGVGAAAAVSQAVEAGAFSAMTFIAGRLNAEAVAVYQILLNILALVFMVALGIAAASAVLVSEATGRRAPGDAARAGWAGLGLVTLAMAITSILLLLFAPQVGRAYSADAALAAVIAAHMGLVALVLVPDGLQAVAASALRARGDNWFPTFSHVIAYAVAMPALGYWLGEVRDMSVAGLVLAIFWASVLSAGILLARWGFLARAR